MCPDIMAEVSGLYRLVAAATFCGYRRLRVKGEDLEEVEWGFIDFLGNGKDRFRMSYKEYLELM